MDKTYYVYLLIGLNILGPPIHIYKFGKMIDDIPTVVDYYTEFIEFTANFIILKIFTICGGGTKMRT